jgi:excisionase family DNA binding protein
MSRRLSVRDICERYSVSEHTVLAWIRSGELRAAHVGRKLGARKPRWRISEEALAAFEALRTPTPPPPQTRRRKRPRGVIKFFE